MVIEIFKHLSVHLHAAHLNSECNDLWVIIVNVCKIRYVCTHLNLGTADVFMPASIAGASDQLRESMLSIAKTSAQLECTKLRQHIAAEFQKQQREQAARQARTRVWAAMAAQHEKDKKKKGTENPQKKARKDPVISVFVGL